MAGIVQAEEDEDDGHRSSPEAEGDERDERREWQPARPDEPIADAAERSAERRAETLDALGRHAAELRARERADGDGGEIRMRVEVRALARHGRLEGVAVHAAGQAAQHGLQREADAVAEQRLVVPRALNGEQAAEHAHPRHGGDARRGRRCGKAAGSGSGRHRVVRSSKPTSRPAAKYQRAPRAEWKIVHAAAAATAHAAPTVTAVGVGGAAAVGLVEGSPREFKLPLDVRGTAFQQRVWQALRDIPAGTTASYRDIAARIGSPASVNFAAHAGSDAMNTGSALTKPQPASMAHCA